MRLMRLAKILFVVVTAALVIGGHAGLWLSDRYPDDLKLKLTILNAIGWAVILLPALAVSRWAAQHRGPSDPSSSRDSRTDHRPN
ncbi:hypothetical protein SAMN04488012_102473 [Palleronia salina]|uniref:Phenylalanyl-tRNA synthetase subunit beta n=2 Tax=Palleronia salina TaxID=313368 RepID=A0A1M6DPJ6_9RHOB|nr:hypothetical protein SAMN04488012_102473 [Palleronia salina]